MKKLGLQLYSVRDTMKDAEGIRETFRRIKEMGYDEAQTAGCAIPYAEFAALAKEAGIAIIGTHEGFGALAADPDTAMEHHRILGTTNIGTGGYGFTDEKSVHEFCETANRFAEKIAPYGFKFTYHNHSGEFRRVNETETIFDILEKELDPVNTSFCFDTYWAQHGGIDVCAWIERLAGRIDILHLKDMAIEGNDPYITECGHGNLNFDGIIPLAEKTGVKYFCVEQDIWPGDPFESVAYSAKYLKKFMK